MPGLVPGIHGVPLQRTSLLNSRVFPQPVDGGLHRRSSRFLCLVLPSYFTTSTAQGASLTSRSAVPPMIRS
jgi:hypothetical protein